MTTVHDWLARCSAWGWPLLANHLWQATLFCALCFLAVLVLKQGPSRTRHTIWLIAGLKFAVPSAFLLFLAERAGLSLSAWFGSTAAGANRLAAVGQFTAPVFQATDITAGASGHNELYCGLTLVWFSGVAILLGLWLKRRLQFSSLATAGRQLTGEREAVALNRALGLSGTSREVDLIVSSGVLEPGVWRVFRPAILLPAGMADDLSDAELEAVLLHELVHISRRDNLVSNLHMMLCCLLWFHPLTWIIDRKLLIERERACDEAAIGFGGRSDVYASSLLKVLRFCLGWKIAGISRAGGSNLRRRVERIMAKDSERKLSISHRVVLGTVVAAVIAFSIAAGLMSRAQVAAQVNPPQTGASKGGVPGNAAGPNEGELPALPFPGVVQSKDVNEALMSAPESNLQFKNPEGVPVSITEASIRFVKVDGFYQADDLPGYPPGTRLRPNIYLMRPNLRLVNNTDRRVTAVTISYETPDGTVQCYYFERLSSLVEPHASFTLNNRATPSGANPSSVVARVSGVMFEDRTSWGDAPPPPPPPAPPPPPPPAVVESGADAALAPPPGSPVIRKSGGVLHQSAIERVQPDYPALAKVAQVSGAVVVEVLVDEEGNVSAARAVNGHPLLRDAAVTAARNWKFTPTTLSGEPVRVVGTITFNFTL